MKKLSVAILSLCSVNAFSAVPELPFPTGSCSGLIPLDSSQVAGGEDGAANVSLVLDFDDQSAYGAIIFFGTSGPDDDDKSVSQWSLDQDGSGITLDIVRDELIPASFIVSMTIDDTLSDDIDLGNLEPTGNEFELRELVFRMLPSAGGASYVLQGVSTDTHGFCNAL